MLIFDPRKHKRQNTLDFKPPMPNPLVQFAFRNLLPYICENVLKGLTVEMDEASLEKLRKIKGQRCLILPNHPSEWDPCVLFDIAKRLNENFFFVAAREVFDYSYGMRGWFFQRLGVYSLVRGSNDRKSLKTSIDVLSQNKGRLVIFVEGEISNQNETLLPLESGVIQLAFMALNELYKENGKKLDVLPSLYICPVGLRYVYEEKGLQKAVTTSVSELEEAIGCTTSAQAGTLYERVRLLASAVLAGASAQLGYPLNADATLVQNVRGLSDFMLTKLEQVINIPPQPSLSHLDRIRTIRNTMDKILGQPAEEEPTLYAKRLSEHQKNVLKNFYEDLDRVVNFIAIYDGYLQPDMDEARYVELLRRLEKEVFGEFHLLHPRKAYATVQEPIDLNAYFEPFLADKKGVVNQLAMDVEQKIYSGIQQTMSDTKVSVGV